MNIIVRIEIRLICARENSANRDSPPGHYYESAPLLLVARRVGQLDHVYGKAVRFDDPLRQCVVGPVHAETVAVMREDMCMATP